MGRAPTGSRAGRLRAARGVVLALAVVVAAAGCQATAKVDVTVHPDGTGQAGVTVRVDADAAKRLPPPDQLVATGDLRRAGWKVIGPTVAPDGSFTVRVSKGFKGVKGGNQVLRELSGADGPLRGLHLERHVSLTETRWELAGSIDLSRGPDAFGDSALTKALGNHSMNDLAAGLRRPGDGPAGTAVQVGVRADLPGRDRRSPVDPETGLGEPARKFTLSSVDQHGSALWLAVGAAIALALALLSLWWAMRGWRHDRRVKARTPRPWGAPGARRRGRGGTRRNRRRRWRSRRPEAPT